MLTITVAVGLLLQGSITVDAAETYELPYIMVLEDTRSNFTWVYASDTPIHLISPYRTSGIIDFGVLNGYSLVKLAYNEELGTWNTVEVIDSEVITDNYYIYGEYTIYSSGLVFWAGLSFREGIFNVTTNYALNSYEQSELAGYSNDLSQLPQGLSETVIREIIDEQLNTSTESGQTAQTIINNTTNQYNLYLAGDIDSDTMQQTVTSNIDTLSDLTPSTLLDAMQINNGLTYNQTIQDQLLNTASGTVQSSINQYITNINTAVSNYQSGNVSQADTVTIIQQQINALNELITSGSATTTADINAVNAAINTANANLDSVTGYKDVSQESSEKSQASDQAELDYLEELTAETTATVEQIAPSKNFTSTQTGEARQVLDLIWENEFVKRLLPMCAGFMVVCVVLGIRYKV